jgi:hypothetical protein
MKFLYSLSMNLRRGFLSTIFRLTGAALLLASFSTSLPVHGAEKWAGPTFQEFSGVNQGSPDSPSVSGGSVGWERHDIYWSQLEPTPGNWRDDSLQRWGETVLAFKAHGVQVLPVLDFNTSWSFDRGARTWEFGKDRWQLMPRPDGKYDEVHYTEQQDNTWKQADSRVTGVDDKWPLAAEHVKDWENYVRRVVTFLRRPPYNVEYFQIWNEAHPNSGFWDGDMDDYINRVQLPAARVIHELGGKVVYGGWPCCGALRDLTALLDKNKAWSSIDVIDVHYEPVSAWDYLHKAAVTRGFSNFGYWQTELGFTKDFGFVSNTYPRMLAWSLATGWTHSGEHKVFYFADWSPEDPAAFGYDCTLRSGSSLSPHGQSLTALSQLLGAGVLHLQKGLTTTPALQTDIDEKRPSIESFRVGQSIVIAVHWDKSDPAQSLAVQLPFPLTKINSVERVDVAGGRSDVTAQASASSAKQTAAAVSVLDDPTSEASTWFANSSIRTFYVVITLK